VSPSLLYVNLVHRVDTAPDAREALAFQWNSARGLGLPTTSLLTYPALLSDEVCAEVAALRGPGDELGIHYHGYMCQAFADRYGIREGAFWLLPQAIRAAFIDETMALFTSRFGAPPAAIGGYVIDAWTLRHIRERHPSVRIAITSCFEEGVKMYYGNNRNWLLFSDGGPWNPYFPSQRNALAPAHDADEAIDIVAVPHLNRDMIMALSSRDDLFASHPGNAVRARINQGGDCPYLIRHYLAWERQAQLNGWSYLNIFVSSPWMSPRHWCVDRIEDARKLYLTMLEHVKARQEAGAVAAVTMSGFDAAYRQRVRPGDATVCHWRDEIKQGKRQVVWTVNSHHRCAFDMALGGALVDFRPYDGRPAIDLGPECPALWNGNSPFLVSAEHCGGHWNTGHLATITDGKHSVGLHDRRVRCEVRRTAEGGWLICAEPATYQLGGRELVVRSTWEVGRGPAIAMRRTVLAFAGDAANLRLVEQFSGRPGTTEYPVDMRGIRLWADDVGRGRHELPCSYSGRQLDRPAAAAVGADVPHVGARVVLRPGAAAVGSLQDGLLFTPSFRVGLTQAITLGQETLTWLETSPLPSR